MKLPWISMKDRMPPSGERVLAVNANPIIGTAIISTDGRNLNGEGYHKELFVTHWCPTSEIELPTA